ncbi:MAG: hypothetical protein ACOC04_02760, partial [Halothece sp.]
MISNKFALSNETANVGNEILTAILQSALDIALKELQAIAITPNFSAKMQLAFDQNLLPNWQTAWAKGEFHLPNVEIRAASEINGANGAFAGATNTIYLAQEFLYSNRNNLDAVVAVLLEEYGHFVDYSLNSSDAPGDEGAIFSALVLGKTLSESELQQLKVEDDTASVVLDSEMLKIEQNTTGTITLVSVASDGTQGNNSSVFLNANSPKISADGRYIVFFSAANNLVAEDQSAYQGFIHDRVTKQTKLISVDSDGNPIGDAIVVNPTISG